MKNVLRKMGQRETGPNGFPIGYDRFGNKVEWIIDEEFPDQPFPFLLLRSEMSIHTMYKELSDQVWYYRYLTQTAAQVQVMDHSNFSPKSKDILKQAQCVAMRLEERYGKENLNCDHTEYLVRLGRLSSLAWVLGSDWNESMDT